jgi:hypothetical protein
VKIVLDIPAKRIADLMTTAICSGYSGQWCAGVFIKGAWEKKETSDDFWYASPEVFEGDFTIEVHEYYDKLVKHRINAADMLKGFALFAKEGRHAFSLFMDGNEDGPAADVWLQCVALGEIRYC